MEIDLLTDFRSETWLCTSLTTRSPKEITVRITNLEKTLFYRLSPEDFKRNSGYCREIDRKWVALSEAVKECALVDYKFPAKACEIAKCLLAMRNMNSMIAVLQGIRTASRENAIPPDLAEYSRSDFNYASIRQAVRGRPGLPFLFAHRRQYELHGLLELKLLFNTIISFADDPCGGGRRQALQEAKPTSSTLWGAILPCFA
ncbi:MAG: hypothetical protein M4579_007188 [Chaenotheca gracillima]|nr:MAG: hypothetical protein M4579_007188 [Chaenotheca gracillima]